MARSTTNPLSHEEKERPDERRLLLNLSRTERWMLRALRLWALRNRLPRGQAGVAEGWAGDWRVAFLASLEPAVTTPRHVQLTPGGIEDALADFNGWLSVVTAAPEKTWRFHHPGCLGLDGDEVLLLDLLRIAARGDQAGALAMLCGQLPGKAGVARAERAQRYLVAASATLRQMGVAFPFVEIAGGALH